MTKKYKALILDVDGTLIPNEIDGMPSQKVVDAISRARKVVHIGIATGRPLHRVSYILKHLSLSGPCIINGGTQIVDMGSYKIIKQQAIDPADVYHVIQIAKELDIALEVAEEDHDADYYEGYPIKNPLGLFTKAIKESSADAFVEKLEHFPNLAAHKTSSWEPNSVHVGINHALATKQHGILEVAQILNIEPHEIIGVGDHYNDFPLLMACGLKVAMGNAVPDLQAIADYIAPTVDDDGVADVIEKFILS